MDILGLISTLNLVASFLGPRKLDYNNGDASLNFLQKLQRLYAQ